MRTLWKRARVMTAGVVTAGLLGGALGLGGCTGGYSSWPPVAGDTAFNDINGGASPAVMATALRWAARKFPPVPDPEVGEEYDNPFALNLPPGTSDEVYLSVTRQTSPYAHALTPDTEELPTYHVRRVDVRGPVAEVDIVRPVIGMSPGPTGQTVYQGVTAILHGGSGPWRVVNHRVYALGLMDVPAANYLPRSVQRRVTDTRPASGPSMGEGTRVIDPDAEPTPAPASEPMRPMQPEGER